MCGPRSGSVLGGSARELSWAKYLEQGYVIAGSPSTVRQQLVDGIRGLRVGHLMVLLQIGSMPRELTFRNTELFGRAVLPHLRDLWPGYKDRRWPSGAREAA